MKFGILIRLAAGWVGYHYSAAERRICINLLPFVTLWICLPGGREPKCATDKRMQDFLRQKMAVSQILEQARPNMTPVPLLFMPDPADYDEDDMGCMGVNDPERRKKK